MSDFYQGVCLGALGLLAFSFVFLAVLWGLALARDTQEHRDNARTPASDGSAP